jgi:hypothetical protein
MLLHTRRLFAWARSQGANDETLEVLLRHLLQASAFGAVTATAHHLLHYMITQRCSVRLLELVRDSVG